MVTLGGRLGHHRPPSVVEDPSARTAAPRREGRRGPFGTLSGVARWRSPSMHHWADVGSDGGVPAGTTRGPGHGDRTGADGQSGEGTGAQLAQIDR